MEVHHDVTVFVPNEAGSQPAGHLKDVGGEGIPPLAEGIHAHHRGRDLLKDGYLSLLAGVRAYCTPDGAAGSLPAMAVDVNVMVASACRGGRNLDDILCQQQRRRAIGVL